MASIRNKIARRAAAKDRPRPESTYVKDYPNARTPLLAIQRHFGDAEICWVDEATGTFQVEGDAQMYRSVRFCSGHAIVKVSRAPQGSLPGMEDRS